MRVNTAKAFIRGSLYFIVIIGIITMIVPCLWMLSTSFKTYEQALSWPPRWIPKPFIMQPYVTVLTIKNFSRYIYNTTVYAAVGTIGCVFLSSLAGFAFAKYQFPGRDIIFMVLLATLMIPGQVTLVPVFLFLKSLGWLNTYLALIVPGLGDAFGIFLVRQFARGIPTDLIEAARLDGCSEFRIYWKIFLSLCIPIVSTLAVLNFMWRWNDLFWPLIVTRGEERRTIQVALTLVCRTLYDVIWNELMAGMTLATLPIIALFIFFQRYFTEGITLTGLKG